MNLKQIIPSIQQNVLVVNYGSIMELKMYKDVEMKIQELQILDLIQMKQIQEHLQIK